MTPNASGQGPKSSSSQTWRSAFLAQARSDHKVFQLLNERRVPLCQQLHYLQMTTEKLAKGFACSPTGRTPPPRVHPGFVRFVREVRKMPWFRRACGMNVRQLESYIDGLLPLAHQIEKLAPIGGGHRPNPEYPWEEHGAVISPLNYDYRFLGWGQPRMAKMLHFIAKCLSFA